MALRLAEVEPRDYVYVCTPTGDELPEMLEHWEGLEVLLGKPLVRITNRTLGFWIGYHGALPNHNQRWCTRLLKIEPYLAWLQELDGDAVSYVGLRADEGTREGVISDDIKCRFPLREWGWGLPEVLGYLHERGVSLPRRTDCARCYHQRIGEWWDLWNALPETYESAVAHEQMTGHTFRTPGRDSWPSDLVGVREMFQAGHVPPGVKTGVQTPSMFEDDGLGICRVCTL